MRLCNFCISKTRPHILVVHETYVTTSVSLVDTCGSTQVPALDVEELQQQGQYSALLAHAPEEFLCPISLQLLTDPVVSPAGVTYNR